MGKFEGVPYSVRRSKVKSRLSFGVCGLAFALAAGCRSKTQECMERTDKTYEEAVAKCSDDACKKKAIDEKASWYEACKELK
jgi:hypothetical protein